MLTIVRVPALVVDDAGNDDDKHDRYPTHHAAYNHSHLYLFWNHSCKRVLHYDILLYTVLTLCSTIMVKNGIVLKPSTPWLEWGQNQNPSILGLHITVTVVVIYWNCPRFVIGSEISLTPILYHLWEYSFFEQM